jgi:hypothetical protein
MALEAGTDLAQGYLPPTGGDIRRVRSASKAVLNAAIGAQFRLSPIADLLMGMRTDLNHLDRSGFDKTTDLSGTFSYWDLYHFSCGVALHSKRVKLTSGLVYAFGTSNDPLDDFYRGGTLDDALKHANVHTRYDQLGLTLGFSYFILGNAEASTP